jgi:hypothetical protein
MNFEPTKSSVTGNSRLGKPRQQVVLGVGLLPGEKELACRKDQKRPEDIQDPVKLLDQNRPGDDHHGAHDQRSQNPPKQDPVCADYSV